MKKLLLIAALLLAMPLLAQAHHDPGGYDDCPSDVYYTIATCRATLAGVHQHATAGDFSDWWEGMRYARQQQLLKTATKCAEYQRPAPLLIVGNPQREPQEPAEPPEPEEPESDPATCNHANYWIPISDYDGDEWPERQITQGTCEQGFQNCEDVHGDTSYETAHSRSVCLGLARDCERERNRCKAGIIELHAQWVKDHAQWVKDREQWVKDREQWVKAHAVWEAGIHDGLAGCPLDPPADLLTTDFTELKRPLMYICREQLREFYDHKKSGNFETWFRRLPLKKQTQLTEAALVCSKNKRNWGDHEPEGVEGFTPDKND